MEGENKEQGSQGPHCDQGATERKRQIREDESSAASSEQKQQRQGEMELTSDHSKWPNSTHMGKKLRPSMPRSPYEVFTTERLCKERRQRLREKYNELVDWMDITDSCLLDSLVAKQVITAQQKQIIECGSKNEDQVSELIKFINKMDNGSFEEMINILDGLGQGAVVRNILLTPGDFIHAREKLANYFLAEFTDIQLYLTEKDDIPIKLDKIYVSMTWKAMKDSTNTSTHTNQDPLVSSYFHLFQKLKNREETHLVVTGKPGAGKTTFVKRVCHQWAQLVLEKTVDYSEDGVETLECYTFVIPIILRLVNHDQTLLEIIKSQFSCLSKLDFNCISTVIAKYPQDVLVILDGYDEFSIAQTCLHQTISKEKNKDITLVVTTRPHGLTLIKQLGGNAIDQLAQLCGFNRDQIVKYIALYFYKNAQLGTELKTCLFDDRLDLLELAYTPVHLQMICIVWNAHRNLGSNLVDLYLKFILCLLDHFEKKCFKKRSKEEAIFQNHKELLTKVGRLANQWQGSQLTTTFSYDTLQKICQNHLESTITLGCITKYHPSNELEKSHWTFTHLTLQEFFVAHFLSQTTDDQWYKDFANCCSQINRLERNSVILKFLAGLAPNMTNKVLQAVVKRTKNKEECTHLLKVLLDIIPEYNRLADVDLPVPRHVDADDIKQSESALRKIFFETSEENLSNVYELTTENFAKSLYTKCLPYISVLNLTVNSGQCIASMVDKARSMTKLASFTINIKTPTTDSQKEVGKCLVQLLGGSHMKTVTSVSLKGSRVVNHAKSAIDKAPKLRKLALELHSKEIRAKDLQSLCSLIEQKESIGEVHLEIDNINHALLKISSRVRLTLIIKKLTLEALKSFVEILKLNNSKTGISRLILHNIVKGMSSLADRYRTLPSDFEDNHSKSEENLGKHLGYLILNSPSLTMLDCSKCVLSSREMQAMDEAIPADQPLSIKKLSLLLVELSHNETHLRKLLQGMPQLQSLQLHGFQDARNKYVGTIISIYDWKTVCDSIKLSASLRDLQLTKISIDKEAASALGELWHHVTHLQVLSVPYCKITPDAVPLLLGGPGDDRLQQLRVLDISRNDLGDEGVRHLASRLPSLSSLQALSVATCSCYDIATLLYLVKSLPHSLTHLDAHDFSANPYGFFIEMEKNTNMVQLTQHKDRLACLQRLNIGDRSNDEGLEDTVEAIRQELLTVNPDIQVYHDKEEDLWKMYVDNKGDPF